MATLPLRDLVLESWRHLIGPCGKRQFLDRKVPVLPDNDANALAARVLTQERLIYPRATAELLSTL